MTPSPTAPLRQWAEVVYVPSKKSEHKHGMPLRYIGLRLLKAQCPATIKMRT